MRQLTVTPVLGLPEVRADDDVAALVVQALATQGRELDEGDVVVVSSKVISKSLGLWASSEDRAAVVTGQSVRVVAERMTGDRVTRIVQSTSGPVMAAAGVDASNTGGVDGLLLLPADPDAEAARLREALVALTGLRRVGVVVSDTAGRAWRVGQVDFALGAAGVQVTDDLRGGTDADGQPLHVTTRAVVDELAAAADLAKGKVDHIPVAVVSGTGWATVEAGAGARGLVRPQRDDWFDYGRAEAVRAALGVEPGSAGAERVGIPGVGTEDVLVRVERAVGVACAGLGFGAGADASRAGVVEVSAGTAFRAGLVVARLQVALWGEGFDSALDGDAVHGERSEGKAATGGAGGWRAEGEVGDWRARVTYTQR